MTMDVQVRSGGRRRALLVVGLVLLLVLAACQPAHLRSPVPLPDGRRNFPDPTIFYAAGRYHAYSTTSFSSPVRNIQVMTSSDLYSWTGLAEAMPSTPSWARSVAQGGEFWAPTVGRFGNTYVLYFGAKHKSAPADRPGWCIGYATSTNPAGPFTPASRPLLCQVTGHSRLSGLTTAAPGPNRGVFDPQIYVAPNGATYLHFKANDNPYQLWGVGLSSSGQSIRTQGYGMVEIDDQARVWEYSSGSGHGFTILENPSMDYNAAAPSPWRYYLYYSGGDWRTSSYGTGVAACQGPLGPCFRATAREPWLETRGGVGGPGGLSVFRTASGSRWVAYHSWERGKPTSNGRRLHIEPLGYQGITPLFLNRGANGTFSASSPAPGLVAFTGTADDPDTGRRVLVIIKEGSNVVSQPTAGANTAYSAQHAATPGAHRYCAFVRDDNGLGTRGLGCRNVTVVAGGGAQAPGGTGGAGASTTTAAPPSTTSSTSAPSSTSVAPTTVPTSTSALAP